MATWRQQSKLETVASQAGGAVAEFAALLVEMSPSLEPHRAAVMEAGRTLADAMRAARQASTDVVVGERGWPK